MTRWHASVLPGITLRDYFAVFALQGILSASSKWELYPPDQNLTEEERATKVAYLMADAMLRQREAR